MSCPIPGGGERRPKPDSGGCPAKRHKSVNTELASALGVVNIGGIFVVLLCGLAFAVIVAILGGCSIDFFVLKLHEDTNQNLTERTPFLTFIIITLSIALI